MYSVGQLAKRFAMSRSALLYYDSLGLLRPAARSSSNYRVYDERACARLESICRYREVGLSLGEIAELLDRPGDRTTAILQRRLTALNEEIGHLREQQRVVVRLLRGRTALPQVRALDKKRWVQVLAASGLSDEDMHRWHVEFERLAPEGHQDFLESLGIPTREIASIRAASRTRRRRATSP